MKKKDFSVLEGRLDKYFKKYIKEKAFPGAALGFLSMYDTEIAKNIYCYGKINEKGSNVDKSTFFDLASLTKPLVTVLCLLCLMKEGKIDWNTKLDSLVSFHLPEDKKGITLVQLMSHNSGLPAYRPYYERLAAIPFPLRKRKIEEWILGEDLEYMPGSQSVYSDLGYIILGNIIEEISGFPLDEYWLRKIAAPLSLQKKLFFPKNKKRDNIVFASTNSIKKNLKDTSFRVHDKNAATLGGVAGHAGLFGTIEGVLSLCENLLLGWIKKRCHPSFLNEDLILSFKKNKKLNWTPGFDTPSSYASSSGKFFSKVSVGHLGFTGTSFWIDLEKKIVIVLLTNRVFWGEDNKMIKRIRPVIHDHIMEELLHL